MNSKPCFSDNPHYYMNKNEACKNLDYDRSNLREAFICEEELK